MTKKDIEIKVDVMRQFQLLRSTTFKDPLCFLDEDFQNADRSGAKNIHVTHQHKMIIIENDGDVLADPEVLFTIGKSGWGDHIQNTESPFGMGFFSNIPTSNYIEIFSGHHRVVFDEREGLAIYSEEVEEYYEGFKLILHDFQLPGVFTQDIKERVELLGKHIQNIRIFYNENEIEKKSLTVGDGLPFDTPIEDDELMMGWLSFSKSILTNKGVQIFYKGRFVTSLSDVYYAKGELHVNDKALTLQSPDRKDIIKDEKFSKFKNHVKSTLTQMAEIAVLSGDEKNIQMYEDALENYVDIHSIRHRIPYSIFDGKTEEDVSFLSDMALAMTKNENIKTIGECEVYLRKPDEPAEEEVDKLFEFSINEEKQLESIEPEEESDSDYEDSSSHYYSSSYSNSSPSKTENKENMKTEPIKISKKIYVEANNREPLFWVKLAELNTFKKRINLIKEYGIRLIIAQNKIEENSLKYNHDSNIHHLIELDEKVTIKSNLSNVILNAQEKRATMLLDMVSRMYGYENNIFRIGDVMVTKLIEVPKLDLTFETIEEDINVVADKEESLIYIDRSLIQHSMLSSHTEETIELNDYKFLLLHLKHIIDEVKLLGFENKEELYEKTLASLAIA